MNKALEVLKGLKQEYSDEYFSTEKDYRAEIGSKLRDIEEAIEEIEYLISYRSDKENG